MAPDMILELRQEIPMTRTQSNPLNAGVEEDKETITADMVSISMTFEVYNKLKWSKKN